MNAWIEDASGRTPLTLGPGGRVERLPTAAQLRAKARLVVDVPASTRFGMSLSIEPRLRPAAEMPAPELAAAVAQAARGARRAAGLMRFAMPKLEAVTFQGAREGEVVFADGRTAPLPVKGGEAVFRPADHPGAQQLRFRAAPRRMQIEGA